MKAETPPSVHQPASGGTDVLPVVPAPPPVGTPPAAATPAKPPTRFYGSVRLDALRMVRDVATLSKEVVEHLTCQLDAEVEVTMEIQARVPGGISEKTVRDVTENCRTLKFKTFEFEVE